ncbi:MAG: H(+)/Cl(-) exchange transporter ClcA [Chromatiaceae bacterium]|nr:MAG: H(+)/Cl(-) exchange transporter ClcA [Chromatiaceae bacterium]
MTNPINHPITHWWLAARGGVLIPRRDAWRLYLAAALVGGGVGLMGAAFHAVLDHAQRGRGALRAALAVAPLPGWLLLMTLAALLLTLSLWLVRRFAPETAGSGIPEVEAILAGARPLRWQRVLPVKFVAGALAIGSGLVLGREGPTVHIGAAVGQLAAERLGGKGAGPDPAAAPISDDAGRVGDQAAGEQVAGERGTLIAAGAAAGLAAAFNAPLAAIVFVTEELREHFTDRFDSIQSVILASCAAVIVSGWLLGQGPALPMPNLSQPPLATLPLFLLLGMLIGVLGVIFNWLIQGAVRAFRALPGRQPYVAVAGIGLTVGVLLWFAPQSVGGGEQLVETLFLQAHGAWFLLGLLAVRLLTSAGSYGTGVPGGIFAPMLALGTITGALFAELVALPLPGLGLDPRVFAVAAMGALFAATVRAPLTGIILVIELTGAQPLALPIILTCLSATFTAAALKGQPIYTLLLAAGHRSPPRAPRRVLLGAGLILVALLAIDPLQRLFEAGPVLPDQRAGAAATPSAAPVTPPTAPAGAPVLAARPSPARKPDPNTEIDLRRAPKLEPELETDSAPALVSAPVAEPAAGIAADLDLGLGPTSATATRHGAGRPVPSMDATAVDIQPAPPVRGPPVPASLPGSAPGTASGTVPGSAPASARTAATDVADPAAPRYSIQLISFRNPDSLRPFVARAGLSARAHRLETGVPDPRWHPVLLGEFTDRAAAAAALAGLPADLQALAPIIRRIGPDEQLRPITGADPSDAE